VIGRSEDEKRCEILEEELFEYRTIVEASEDHIAVVDRHGVYRMANAAYLAGLGLSRSEVVGQKVEDVLSPEVYEIVGPNLRHCFEGQVVEYCMRREYRDLGVRDVKVRYEPLRNEGGRVDRALVIIRDITERTRARETLRESEKLFRELVENIREAIWLRDQGTDSLLYVSPAYKELFGLPDERLAETSDEFMEAVHPEDRRRVAESLKRLRRMGRHFNEEYRIVGQDGEERWIWARTWPIDDGEDQPRRLVGIAEDITERKHLEEQMRRMATVDSLTGIDNRHHFLDKAGKEFTRAHRYGHVPSLLMLDLDRFKAVNDTYGHHAGDEVLKAFAKAINGELRENDLFGRLGGEEFAVVLPETGPEGAVEAAERLRVAVESTTVDVGDATVVFTVSIGATVFEREDSKISDALQRADRALYLAKEQGRNRVVMLRFEGEAFTV
jgi:diguanylate cyclase (GGDEF)-like protein/PAS domain S-box-containing protein